MKRIFAIVFSVVFVFAAVVPAFAVSAATETETYTEYYGDGSYTVVTITATPVANAARAASQTTAGTKTTDYYDSADKLSGVRRLEAFLHTTAQQQPAPAQQFLMRFIAANGNAIRRSPPRAATPQEVILNSISIRLL